MLKRVTVFAARGLALAGCLSALTGCGWIKGMAINSVASTLSQNGSAVTSDNDVDLIGDAFPFTLKLYESLLESVPKNKDLLLATCQLAAEYGYGYLEGKADILGEAHHDERVELRTRALNMYLRGKGYCTRALDLRFKGLTDELMKDPDGLEKALKRVKDKKDVPLLYWTAVSWGAAISLAKDKPAIVIDFPVVRALAERALVLDETYSKGALHEMMITLDSLPPALGGNVEHARQHFARAVELQHGLSPGPYVSLAMNVAQPAQDRAEFVKLLDQALAIDPEKNPSERLITLLVQRKARAVREQVDTLFGGTKPLVAVSSRRR